MIVDYQCIFPSVPATAGCYHTKVITTSTKQRFGSIYMEFNPENAVDTAKEIIRLAIENYPNRNRDRVRIPERPMKVMAGFSEETIRKALGGTYKPLIDAIVAGKILGCVGIVGCNNPRIKQDHGHITLAKELIRRNILVVETGCAAIACGKAGLFSSWLPNLQEKDWHRSANSWYPTCPAHGFLCRLFKNSCSGCKRCKNWGRNRRSADWWCCT